LTKRRTKALLLALVVFSATVLLWALTRSDTFTRADSNSLGADWTRIFGEGAFDLGIFSNQVDTNGTGNSTGAYWSADTFGDNQFSEVTMVILASGVQSAFTRNSTTARTRYEFGHDTNNFNARRRFWKYVAGTQTSLADCVPNQVAGNIIRLESDGSTHTFKVNGTAASCSPFTDAAIASGKIGIRALHNTANVAILDTWSGGDLGVARRRNALVISWIFGWLNGMITRPVRAQVTFTRLYLAPVETRTNPQGDTVRVVKYEGDFCAVSCGTMDFGFEPVMLVGATVDGATDATLTANADVVALPVNLDVNLTAAEVTAVQAKLEAVNIPAGWVTTSLTWRQLVRTIVAMFQFAQRYNGVAGNVRLFPTGVTLSTRWNQLSPTVQTNLTTTATSLGYSTTGLSGTTTLRTVLKNMADQWGSRPIFIGGLEI